LIFSIKGIVWRASQQVYLLHPWARHLMACLYLRVVRQVVTDGSSSIAQLVKVAKPWIDFWCSRASLYSWSQAICLSWWAGGPTWHKTANRTVLCWSGMTNRKHYIYGSYDRDNTQIYKIVTLTLKLHFKVRKW